MPERPLDLVLLGATGFTGGLAAEYLARHGPAGLRWGLAGRDGERLAAVRRRLVEVDPALDDLPLLVCDVADAASVADLARQTRVLLTTVGPFRRFGDSVVGACAEAGTDYVDITGEPEFVDRAWLAHHRTAEATGARIVHACGFDSVPHDLGALFTVRELKAAGPVDLRGVVRAGGAFSGGTFHSALDAMSRSRQTREALAERRRVEPQPDGRSSRSRPGRPHRDPVLGYWLLPLPTLDPLVVARSGAALEEYGPRFRYTHYAGTRTLRYAAGGALGVGSLALAARVGPVRRLLGDRVPQGEGPDEARRERAWFTVDFVAEADGRTLHTRVRGGDPGYTETARMVAESALCLAFDDNPDVAGCLTTAQAMGTSLLARLSAAGLVFETVD